MLRAQIIRAQRLESLGTLAAGIAHQFNNINAALKGYMEVLVRVADLPTAALTYVREMTASLQRSVDITDRLQGLTVARHGGAEPVRLDEVVPSLVRFLEGELEAERVSTRVEIEPGTTVQASPSMLSFILTSLLTNALHALLDCTTRIITIRARIAAGYVTLEVSDTGCGIPPEDLPRIFTPFFTTKGEWAPPCSPQAKVKGVGLSLAVCQSTVAEYGGRIEVESEIGTGTTIRVRLPAGAVASTSIGLPQRSGSALTSGGPSPNGPAS